MELIPLDSNGLLTLAAGWLSEERNARWLDLGNGQKRIDPVALGFMTRKDSNVIRAFTDDERRPIGLVALNDVDRSRLTAAIWIALGDKRWSGKGLVLRAAALMLDHGFRKLGLQSVLAWSVECNHPSLRLIRQLGFRPIGRQRMCHYLDGRPYDRLWFDLLASEFDVSRHL